jgi:hypothetical protein
MLNKKLDGLRAELADNDSVEVLSFNDGSITATLGVKNGPVTAPILEYKITGDNSLIIQGGFEITWENVEFSGKFINVVRNGKLAMYNITKNSNVGCLNESS